MKAIQFSIVILLRLLLVHPLLKESLVMKCASIAEEGNHFCVRFCDSRRSVFDGKKLKLETWKNGLELVFY